MARKHFHWWMVPIIVLVLLVVAVAIALQPVAKYETRQAFNKLQGFHGDFLDTHVSLIPLRYRITHVKLEEDDAPKGTPPLFYADVVQAQVDLRRLLKFQLAAGVRIEKPKITIVQAATPKPKVPAKKPNLDIGDQLEQILPFDVNRVEMKGGDITYAMGLEKDAGKIWLHDLEMTLENLASRRRLTQGTTTLALSGTVQHSGQLSAFVTAEPLAKSLTFDGRVRLTDLKLNELYGLIGDKTDLKPVEGTVDMFATFEGRNNHIKGGLKPVLKNVKIKSDSGKVWDKLKASLVDKTLKIFADRVPGREAVATVVPIQGSITDPKVGVWTTILSVVRNAFVEGLTEGYRNTPPPEADKPQGVVAQARRALSKKGGVPLTQPPKEKKANP